MDTQRGERDDRAFAARHRKWQYRVAALFLGAAALVGIWILVGPKPEDPIVSLSVLLFVELPLFVVLALIGMNALVRAGMGPKRKR